MNYGINNNNCIWNQNMNENKYDIKTDHMIIYINR